MGWIRKLQSFVTKVCVEKVLRRSRNVDVSHAAAATVSFATTLGRFHSMSILHGHRSQRSSLRR